MLSGNPASDGALQPPVPSILDRVAAPADSLSPEPRVLLALAHSDDEVLAVGGRLERFGRSRLLTITDSAPRNGADARDHGFASLEEYRRSRHAEMFAALADAGLTEAVAPPFSKQVPDQEAAFHLKSLARALAEEIRSFMPEAILTHPYEGGHPDHDACAFAVHAAVRLAGSSLAILETPFYNAGENGLMRTGIFLPSTTDATEIVCPLNTVEQERKRRRLACFVSQASTLAQFRVKEERFRLAPAYDFTRPPHEGRLLYETFPWGMDGARFRTLAAQGMEELFGTTSNASPSMTAEAGHVR